MKERWRRYRRVHEQDVAASVQDELEFHVSMRAEALRAAGMDEASARREAERRLGDVGALASQCRHEAQRTWRRRRLREDIMRAWRDLVQALRGMRRRPGFFVAACSTLALGIGATTAVYSMVDAVLLAPLPYGDPERLVLIRSVDGTGKEQGVSRAALDAFRSGGGALTDIAAYTDNWRILGGGAEPEEINVGEVERHMFDVLRVRPALGTVFGEEHRFEGGDAGAVILSWSLWHRQFGGSPDVIGQTVELRERPHRVLGVMPAGFEFPVGSGVEAWTPKVARADDRMFHWMPVQEAIARLPPGATLAAAAAEARSAVARQAAAGTDMFGEQLIQDGRPWTATVTPVHSAMLVSDRALVLMLAAVALLLLIGCANVANLFLVRASERRQELVVRAALGGSRRDLALPLLIELLIVCAVAALAGLALAHWAAAALLSLDPGGLPRWDGIRVNARAWTVASFATAVAAITCGVAPALAAARVRPGEAAQLGARSTDSPRLLRLRDAIVGLEIGLVFVLLVGAGLVLRSFSAVRAVEAGYELENVVTARIVLPASRYPRSRTQAATVAFYDRLFERLRAHPAVAAAGGVSSAPMTEDPLFNAQELRAASGEKKLGDAKLRFATAQYFTTLGVPVRGRDFTTDDVVGAPRVAIINETVARSLFPGEDAIGNRFTAATQEFEVVGVVPDLRTEGPESLPRAEYYAPVAQFPFLPGIAIVVRTHAPARTFARTLIDLVRDLDPALPVASVRTLDEHRTRLLARRRFDTIMLGGIALAALALAAVGVFGVMAHAVMQRTREFGIRQALGAQARNILAHVLRRTAAIAVAGIAISALVAVAFARSLRSVLFGIQPIDAVTFGAATGIVFVAALLAAALPAWRATKIDPAVTLRS